MLKVSKNPQKQYKKGAYSSALTLIEWVISLAIIGAFVVFLVAGARTSRQLTAQKRCAYNLTIIGELLQAYARDHAGSFPRTMDEIYPKYTRDAKLFECPAVEDPPGLGVQSQAYTYRPGLTVEADRDAIIIEEAPGNHPHGRHCLTVAGKVQWLAAPKEKTIAETAMKNI